MQNVDHIVMYEFVMSCVASELGDMGEFQISTDLDKRVLKMSLSCKRICTVDGVLYNILWNEIEQQKQCGQYFENEKRTKQLQQCILLSHFCRQDFNEKFYKSKLR